MQSNGAEGIGGPFSTPSLDMLEAAKVGDLIKIRSLVDADSAIVHATGEYAMTPLHLAAEGDFLEIAELLIQHGADIEAETTWGATPLEWAASVGAVRVGGLLLDRGAQGLNLVIAAGLGMLDAVQGFIRSADTLQDLGIPKRPNDLADEKGWQEDDARMKGDVLGDAFQMACRNGHLEVARFLLEQGADVNARGYFGGTGLHWAAIEGHREVVEFLLDHGADANAVDHGFRTKPSGWAMEGGHEELADLIWRRSSGTIGSDFPS